MIRRAARAATFRATRLAGAADAALWRLRKGRRNLLATPTSDVLSRGRRRGSFRPDSVSEHFQHAVELEGRLYNYVHYPADSDVLCVHFSAFFGEWGDDRPHRAYFSGYFHRLRMFWPVTDYNFLFLCDTFGADANGSYYKGESGDFFVERAVDTLVERVREALGVEKARVVALGSSMGATGALRVALAQRYAGIVAVSPHIDLDLSAIHQGRRRHVAAVLGAEDVEAPRHYPVTRQIRALADGVRPLPALAIQSMLDDAGVHEEQVVPLVEQWRAGGGHVRTDFHPSGGHTSEYADVQYFRDSIEWALAPPD